MTSPSGPLAALSGLLGVEVTGVRHEHVSIEGRPCPDPNAWRLRIPSARWGRDAFAPGDGWVRAVHSSRFRSTSHLRFLVEQWSGGAVVKYFTRQQATEIRRLLHQCTEEISS
jgi:hypothetical protein